MIDLTISLTYYGQVDKLVRHLNFFSELDDVLKNQITVQIVNDGFNDQGIFDDAVKLIEPAKKNAEI